MIKYFMPTEVLMGESIVSQSGELFKRFGKKALIVTGKHSSKKNGSLDDCCAILSQMGIGYSVFDEVEENPTLETIAKASIQGIKEKTDFIIGIGGGSPLDAAKVIGILIKNPEITIDTIFDVPALSSLEVIAIPTTSGTGSEVTPYAIVTDHRSQTKRNIGHKVFPALAFLDPSYTYDLPYSITINTAIDAFTHLAEGYLNVNASTFSDTQAEKGLLLFSKSLPALKENQITPEVRADLMIASSLAGFVIAQTGTSLPHGMGYALTYHKGLPHGIANGILFPAYLESFKDCSKLNQMLHWLGFSELNQLTTILKSLVQVNINISLEELENYALQMSSNEAKLKNHPEAIDFNGLFEIYKKSFYAESSL